MHEVSAGENYGIHFYSDGPQSRSPQESLLGASGLQSLPPPTPYSVILRSPDSQRSSLTFKVSCHWTELAFFFFSYLIVGPGCDSPLWTKLPSMHCTGCLKTSVYMASLSGGDGECDESLPLEWKSCPEAKNPHKTKHKTV
jgi:hypothetical protein